AQLGALLESFVPKSLQGGHITTSRNVPADSAAHGITFVASAPHLLHFNAGGMFDLERPENSVQDVAAHIAQRAIAEVVPAVPFVRVQVGVVFAERGGADPFIPVQAGWRRYGGRARANAAIGAVGPTVRLRDFSHDAAPDKFAEAAVTVLAVA